jgi:cytochrome P450
MTTTASLPSAECAPVLTFGAQPDGQYPQVLLDDSCGDTVRAPAGGASMRVLRDPKAVLACLDLHSRISPGSAFPRIVMAGAHPVTGALRGCPLTGAEQQSADGGLLNMNPPHLTGYRRQLTGLFSAAAAEKTRPAAQACAAGLVTRLAAAGREADVAAGYAAPFAATMIVQTLGGGDWLQLKAWSDVAFGLVPSPAAVSAVDAVWAELYSYFGTSRLGGLAAAIAARPAGHTTDQVAHVLATVSNGFGAVPPVLIRCLVELLRRPGTVTACIRGEQSWRAVIRHLIGTHVMFPVALPRLVLADTRLGAHLVKAGTLVLPSLVGAARAGAPATIAFGPGPHFCPGAAWTWATVEVATVTFFRSFPRPRLVGALDWQPGTLQVPRQVTVQLWLCPARIMAGTVPRIPYQFGECRQPEICDLAAAGAGGPAPARRLSLLPSSPAQSDRSGQPAISQNRHRQLSAAEVSAETARRELCGSARAARITYRSPLRPRNVRVRG